MREELPPPILGPVNPVLQPDSGETTECCWA